MADSGILPLWAASYYLNEAAYFLHARPTAGGQKFMPPYPANYEALIALRTSAEQLEVYLRQAAQHATAFVPISQIRAELLTSGLDVGECDDEEARYRYARKFWAWGDDVPHGVKTDGEEAA